MKHRDRVKTGLKNKKIGVLMGGVTNEREISLKSGNAVLKALKALRYDDAVAIDIDDGAVEEIVEAGIDLAFIALHGRYGEDGCMQGFLELMGIPYTGSNVIASAIAMDKVATKKVLTYHGIPVPSFKMIKSADIPVLDRMDLPVIVKPVCQGSTIGIELVEDVDALPQAIDEAFKYDDVVIIERFVKGKEFTVGILNERVLPIIEICSANGIFNFEAKYTKGITDYIVPANLPGDQEEIIKDIAMKSYRALGCNGAARIDIMMSENNSLYVLEVNTIPGMTETSLLPMAATSEGIEFTDLIEEIVTHTIN